MFTDMENYVILLNKKTQVINKKYNTHTHIHIERYFKGCSFLDWKISSGFYFCSLYFMVLLTFYCSIIYSYNQNILFSSKVLLNHLDFAYKISSPLHSYNSGSVSGLHYFLHSHVITIVTLS